MTYRLAAPLITDLFSEYVTERREWRGAASDPVTTHATHSPREFLHRWGTREDKTRGGGSLFLPCALWARRDRGVKGTHSVVQLCDLCSLASVFRSERGDALPGGEETEGGRHMEAFFLFASFP
jgi:hypothetical protein